MVASCRPVTCQDRASLTPKPLRPIRPAYIEPAALSDSARNTTQPMITSTIVQPIRPTVRLFSFLL